MTSAPPFRIVPDMSRQPAKFPHFRYEKRCKGLVAGIDEAGRGPLAGPVSAAAVILEPGAIPAGLDDSKKLNAKAREKLCAEIFATARSVSFAFSSVEEIDRLNIRQATLLAMARAAHGLAISPTHILIDGNDAPKTLPCAHQTIVKGDAISLSIAAASIVAKVMRDALMTRLCTHYPLYGFSQHAGYATEYHRAAIVTHGPCPAHRMSFAPLHAFAR